MPVLTVIMPVYNGEKFLKESIDSILAQTFEDFTLIIVNDNSTDGSQQIIDHYISIDNRVCCLNNDINLGPAKSRNIAIETAKTELIALMDSDDIALPTRFEKQLDFLNSHTNVGVCGTWFTFFGDKKKIIKHNISHEEIKVGFLDSCVVGNPTVMFRKSALGSLRFNETMLVAEDYSLWSEAVHITEFHNIPESLLLYRWHKNNISTIKFELLEKAEFEIRKKQLAHLGIALNDANIEYYINAVNLRRGLSKNDIIKTIEASKTLIGLNASKHVYNQNLFISHIDKVILRTIRNSKENNRSYYKYIKNESGYFSKMTTLDAVVLFFKCLF